MLFVRRRSCERYRVLEHRGAARDDDLPGNNLGHICERGGVMLTESVTPGKIVSHPCE